MYSKSFLIIVLFFTTYTRNLLTEYNKICSLYKKKIFKSINLYKDMTTNNRQDLYKHSLRNIALQIIQKTDFVNQSKNQQKQDILDKQALHFNEYMSFKKIDPNFLLQDQLKLEKSVNKKITEFSKKNLELQKEENTLNQFVEELKECRTNLKNTDFNDHYTTYKKFEQILEGLNDEYYVPERLFNNLNLYNDFLKEKFPDDVKNIPIILQIVKEYFIAKELDEKYDLLIQIKELNLDNEINIQFNQNKELVKEHHKKINSFLKNCIQNLESKMSALKTIFEGYPEYNKFTKTMKNAKDLILKISKLRSEILHESKIVEKLKFQLEVEYLKIKRIWRSEYLEMETNNSNLTKLVDMKPENFPEDDDITTNVQTLGKSYYTNNMNRMEEVNEKYLNQKEATLNINNLKIAESDIDNILGEILGYLQGAGQPYNFTKCFTSMEISLIIYYSSVFQIISSTKSFISSFLNMVTENEQVLILNQMFFDLEKKKLVDSKILNPMTRKIESNGIYEAARKYSMLMNEEIDFIFKEQISNKEMIKGKIATVIGYAGITAKIIGKHLVKGGLIWIFITLTAALAVFIGITSISVVLSILIIGIVLYVVNLLIKYAAKKLSENPQLKYEFMEGVVKLINRFKKDPIQSLEYEEILKEYQEEKFQELSALGKKKESKHEEKLEYFKEMFIKIVDIDLAYDDSLLFEVYDDLFS